MIFKKEEKNHVLASFTHAFLVFSTDIEIEQKKQNGQLKIPQNV